ncbi:hypothetical protein [Candidatus Nanohalovita haloferacivicina]|uniref:hypothetical protein n=1 Tax=Candidatus Nanohalovita haloferacivicina TaxID=2978046 RepID=UPI00325FC8B1|nr:hypothetical protein HBNXNv_0795 [Candidatus Nanohalobia archaeon BNXNv]
MPDYSFDEELRKLYTSEMAYNILHIYNLSNSQLYSKEVTERLNNMGYSTSKESVANYIKQLRDAGFLERGKRTKAQYYKLNYNAFYQSWKNYVLYLLDVTFTDREGEKVTKQDALQDMISSIKENEEDYAPEGQSSIDFEEVEERISGALSSFEQEMRDKYQKFEQVAEDNENLKEFFKVYAASTLDGNDLTIHELFIRILFREILILSWKHEDLPEDLNVVMEALSGCQLSESSTIGSGERAYEAAYSGQDS